MRLRISIILVVAVLCLVPTASRADLVPYAQDFEGLNQADPAALANDGWLIFGNVFDSGWNYKYGYGVYPAPNGGPAFSAVASGQGGPPQGAQQLVVYSDYNNGDHGKGWFIEANVFHEQTIGAADVGNTWLFEFDAKHGDAAGLSSARAFFKTIDPNSGWALTNFIWLDMTGIPASWDRYLLSIYIDPSLEGQLLQFGFLSTATYWEPSGVLYDNVNFRRQPDPRSAGFWKHQCSDLGFTQVSSQELNDLFVDVSVNSDAFTECAPIGCTVLDFEPPANEMRPKTERQALALWLNVASGRLPGDTPIDLSGLTDATTVSEAIVEIETTLCDSGASKSDLETAKDTAEALNLEGEDMELASLTSSLRVSAGKTVTITLGLVNMSPFAESYSLTTSGDWPVSLSQQAVTGLGSGQLAVLTADVYVPSSVSGGQTAQVKVTAHDLFSEVELQREAVIDLQVRGGGSGGRTGSNRPVKRIADE